MIIQSVYNTYNNEYCKTHLNIFIVYSRKSTIRKGKKSIQSVHKNTQKITVVYMYYIFLYYNIVCVMLCLANIVGSAVQALGLLVHFFPNEEVNETLAVTSNTRMIRKHHIFTVDSTALNGHGHRASPNIGKQIMEIKKTRQLRKYGEIQVMRQIFLGSSGLRDHFSSKLINDGL